MFKFLIIALLILLGIAAMPWVKQHLPAQYNPFTPLSVSDPPSFITRYKLRQLASDPGKCLAVLARAREAGFITFTRPPAMKGNCPVPQPIRIQRFGSVTLSSSFLASCPMAVSSTMFVLEMSKNSGSGEGSSSLVRINHLGSYACRNIYHRAKGRLSEHATADAWDVSGFQFSNGEKINVLQNWRQPEDKSRWLHQTFQQSCGFFGNSLGPEYNAAHANHFHLGMRGFGLCH